MGIANIPVNASDIVITRVWTKFNEQAAINTLAWTVVGTPTAATNLIDVAVAFDTLIFANYIALLANQAAYFGVEARKYVSSRLSLPFYTKANFGVGTAGIDAMGRQTCGMFTKQTGSTGAAGRGRSYIAFPSTDDSGADGNPTAGYMTRLGALAANFTTSFTANAGACVLAPMLLRAPKLTHVPPVPASVTPITGVTARQKWATHRSRGTYGRPNGVPF